MNVELLQAMFHLVQGEGEGMSDQATHDYHEDRALRAAQHRHAQHEKRLARELAARRVMAAGPGRCETLPHDAPAGADPSVDHTGFCARGVI